LAYFSSDKMGWMENGTDEKWDEWNLKDKR
jgi:hypothetical protein